MENRCSMALAITSPMRLRRTGSSYIGSSSYGGSESCDCKIVYPTEQLQSVFPANGFGIGPPRLRSEEYGLGYCQCLKPMSAEGEHHQQSIALHIRRDRPFRSESKLRFPTGNARCLSYRRPRLRSASAQYFARYRRLRHREEVKGANIG